MGKIKKIKSNEKYFYKAIRNNVLAYKSYKKIIDSLNAELNKGHFFFDFVIEKELNVKFYKKIEEIFNNHGVNCYFTESETFIRFYFNINR